MNKRKFAGQPAGGGNITILTGRELFTDIAPATPEGFQRRTLFIDNCKNCDKMNDNFLNFSVSPSFQQSVISAAEKNKTGTTSTKTKGGGGFFGDIKFGDVFKPVADAYTERQRLNIAREQGQYALEIEKQRLAQERAKQEAEYAKAQAAMSQSGSAASKIKAYTVPLLVGGVVIIGGIAAYFYFKKKKVS